jgi:hypothetical protein
LELGCVSASFLAIVVQTISALDVSPILVKKNDAPGCFLCASSCAIVLAIIDFPAPAILSSQNMEWSVSLFHQDLIWSNTCKRVPSNHIVGSYFGEDLVAAGEYAVASESNDAPSASSKLVEVLTNAHIGYCY